MKELEKNQATDEKKLSAISPTILAVETCTEICSVALSYKDSISQSIITEPRSHSQKLIPMVQELLNKACIGMENVDYMACSIGPGSFTGVRIGIGVAKGLAYGQDINIIDVSSLNALAHQALHLIESSNIQLSSHDITSVVSLIDARMGELYFAHYNLIDLYDYENNYIGKALQIVDREKLLAINNIDFSVYKSSLFIGNGVDEYLDILLENNVLTYHQILNSEKNNNKINIENQDSATILSGKYPLAKSIAILAKQRINDYIIKQNISNLNQLKQGNQLLKDNLKIGFNAIDLEPLYLRNKVTF